MLGVGLKFLPPTIHPHQHLPLLLAHQQQLLLAQPRLHLGHVKVVLLQLVGGIQGLLPALCLLLQLPPHCPQTLQKTSDSFGFRAFDGGNGSGTFQHLVHTRSVDLDLPAEVLVGVRVERGWVLEGVIGVCPHPPWCGG